MTPLSTWNTPTVPPPLIVSSPAPGPSITSGPAVSDRISVPVSVIVCAAAKTDGSNSISLPLVHGIGIGVRQENDVWQRARRARSREAPARRVDRVGGDRSRDQVRQAE